MKITSKTGWSDFVYNLLYPAFLGSMIYEIFSPAQEGQTYVFYWSYPKTLMVGIAIFYSLDYLHLYEDIRKKKPYNENISYKNVFFDLVSTLAFFLTFILIKLSKYDCGILVISGLPIVFYQYKVNNIKDRIFHIPYCILSVAAGLAYYFREFLNLEIPSAMCYLLVLVYVSLGIYIIYVFYYFEKFLKMK